MDLIPKGWGSRLRAERKRLGYTQVEFARLTSVSTLTYQQYEREEYETRWGGGYGLESNKRAFKYKS